MLFFKRVYQILSIFAFIFCLTGCFSSEKQDALSKYVNEDMKPLQTIETEMIASYQSVTGDNATTDQAFYNELNTKTISLAKDLSDMVSAFTLFADAIKNNDSNLVTQANEKLTKANQYGEEYRDKLAKLGDEYGVKITFEN